MKSTKHLLDRELQVMAEAPIISEITDEIKGKDRPSPTPAPQITAPINKTSNKNFIILFSKNNIPENEFKDFVNEKNIELVNAKISDAREKNINGVPFFEIGKDFISGAQSSIQLESVIKTNLN